jgi:hypothetical protein
MIEVKESYLIEYEKGGVWVYFMSTKKSHWEEDLKYCRKIHKNDTFKVMRYVSVETSERLDIP